MDHAQIINQGIVLQYSEIIRINPNDPYELQYGSGSMGHGWNHRCKSESIGKFLEVRVILRELYVKGDHGLFNSRDGGRTWNKIIRNKKIILELWNSEL